MKFVVKHEIKGRIRVHFCQKRMTFEEADTLQYYLDSQEMITSSKVQERTQDATICYTGEKSAVIALLRSFHYEKVDFRMFTDRIPEERPIASTGINL